MPGESNEPLPEETNIFTFVEASATFSSRKDRALSISDIRSHAARLHHLRRKQRHHDAQLSPSNDSNQDPETADVPSVVNIGNADSDLLSLSTEGIVDNFESVFAAQVRQDKKGRHISHPRCPCVNSGAGSPCRHPAKKKKKRIVTHDKQPEAILPKLRKLFHETPFPTHRVVVDALEHCNATRSPITLVDADFM